MAGDASALAAGPAKPAAHITPEYQEGLSHAYDSAESVAGARDHVLTATDLPDYVERVVRKFVADRAEGQTFAEWAHAADEEALQ